MLLLVLAASGITTATADPAMWGGAQPETGPCTTRWIFLITSNPHSFPLLSLVYLPRMLVIRSVAAHWVHVVPELWPVATPQLTALFNCLVLLPNYLSKCNTFQLLRYNTTLNAFGKSEFHLESYSYSITRAQQAKLKCMLGVDRPSQRRWVGAGAYAPGRQQRGTKIGAVFFCDTKHTKILSALLRQGWAWKDKIMFVEQCIFLMSSVAFLGP